MKRFFLFSWMLIGVLTTFMIGSCHHDNEPTQKKVQKLSITPQEATLTVGETLQLKAVQEPDLKHSVSFTSSATAVATVSSTGLVTALTEGEATITAETDGVKGQCRITVKKKEVTPEPQKESFVIKIDRISASNIFVTVIPKDPQMLYVLNAKTKFAHEQIINKFGSQPAADKAWWKAVSQQEEGEPEYIKAMMREVSSGTKQFDLGKDVSGGAYPFPSDCEIVISVYGIDKQGKEILTPVILVEQKTKPATVQEFTFEISDLTPGSTFLSAKVTPSDASKPYFYSIQKKRFVDFYRNPKPGKEIIDGIPAETYMHYRLLGQCYNADPKIDAFKKGEFLINENNSALQADTDYYLILFGWDEELGITTKASYTPFKTL